ncbi:metallophosphoesterase [Mediterraneibacter agrestimuris]|uniref:metallophosphoesterase n=1 Tax=Mediterraneibacter agrestimuris TaxID=2941333 RepID=UPI00203FA8ED|nr:metallophosphoesterase [Mediterraneibacter agrestimuris]
MKLSNLLVSGAVCAGLIFVEGIREQLNFKVTKYQICTPKMKSGVKPKKIVFLSDLHNTEYGKENARLLYAIRKAGPDLILIGGDMLIGKRGILPEPALNFVGKLPEIAPVYYANGNHEQRMKEDTVKYGNMFYLYRSELCEKGVHFLENESAVAEFDGIKIRLTGLELPRKTYEKFTRYHLQKEDIVKQVGTNQKEKNTADIDHMDYYEILLAHNPVYYHAYKAWGADLVLSGHLHGGIARIPGWRGVITPQAFLFPKYSGEMTEEDRQVIVVSRGLGMHTIKFRLFNRPELIMLEIAGE